MNVLKSFATHQPVLSVLGVTIAWFVLEMLLTGIASSVLRKPYGEMPTDAIGRLGATACVLLLVWRLGWLEASGVARLGSWQVWLLALGGMIAFGCASLYSFYGKVAFDWGLLRTSAAHTAILRHFTASLSEEVMFRGLVLYALVRVWGQSRPGMIASVAVMSLIFAVLHITQVFTHGVSLASALLLILEGCIISIWWGVLVLLGGSIWPAVVLHWGVNAAVAVQGLAVPMVEPEVLTYRRLLWFSIVLGVLGIGLLVRAAPLSAPRAVRYTPGQEGTCARYGIVLDDDSVKALYLDTGTVLSAPDAFLESDPAYRILAVAHQDSGQPFRRGRWLRSLARIDSLMPQQREAQEPFVFARELVSGGEAFCAIAVPHVLPYLPEGTDLRTTVYLTALDDPVTGVTNRHHLVLALSHPQYHYAELLFRQGSSSASNILVHELFHVGYDENWLLRTEHTLENGSLQTLIDGLQNEGMATYVAYKARSLYPSSLDIVYPRLESKLWVRMLIARLNRLFEASETMEPDKLWKKVARIHHRQRATYIVGAYMAQTIEEQLGKESLAATVAEGPISFIRTYNTVAQDSMRLAFQSTPPPEDTVYLQLREAVLAKDSETVEALLSSIETTTIAPSRYEAYALYTTGHLLRHQGQIDQAIRVFQCHVTLCPEDANGYLSLGECYQALGEDGLARAAFEQGLRLNPRAVWAEIALAE